MNNKEQKYVKIEVKALVNLIDTSFKMGFEQACEILESLKKTSGMDENTKKTLTNRLVDKKL